MVKKTQTIAGVTAAMEGEVARPTLELSPDQVGRVILKARQRDAKEAADDLKGDNEIDDQFREILLDSADDPVDEELRTYISDMNIDEQATLITLLWIGRGDYQVADWEHAFATAKREHSMNAVEYLLGTPLLSDHLAEGLSQLGLSYTSATD